jgi:hypothetical protein
VVHHCAVQVCDLALQDGQAVACVPVGRMPRAVMAAGVEFRAMLC